MIYLDGFNLPVDQTKDGGDSAVRAGIIRMCKNTPYPYMLNYEFGNDGLLVRHPIQTPWNNPKNFTRDQLICLLAGIHAEGHTSLARRILWSRTKNLLFSQSSERDKPGSVKYPFPHSFYKDSIPNTLTLPFWKGKVPVIPVFQGQGYPIETKLFDMPDPLMPNIIWCLIKVAKIYPLYFMFIPGIVFFMLNVLVKRLIPGEENQLISEAYINGKWAIKLYKWLNPKWETNSFKYWNDRNEIEYHNMIKEKLNE